MRPQRSYLKRILIAFGVLAFLIFLMISFSVFRGFVAGRRINVGGLPNADHPLFQVEKREDGSVDYLQAINELARQDVADAENFGIVLVELVKNQPNQNYRKRYIPMIAKALNIDLSSERQLLGLAEFAIQEGWDPTTVYELYDSTPPESQDAEAGDSENSRSAQALEIREMWLQSQSANMDSVLHELNTRPKFFVPLVQDIPDRPVFMTTLDHVQYMREIGRTLQARAEYRLKNSQVNEAWKDIRGNFQLGNRAGQGTILFEYMIAVSLHGTAHEQLQTLLDSPAITAELCEEIAAELPQLVQLPPVSDTFDRGERGMSLSLIDTLMTPQGRKALRESPAEFPGENPPVDLLPVGWIDTQELAKNANHLFDSMKAIAQMENAGEAGVAAQALEAEIQPSPIETKLILAAIGKTAIGLGPKAEFTEVATGILNSLTVPAISMCLDASHRSKTLGRCSQVAVAVKRYQLQNGKYPATLEELKDLVDPACLIDIYTGRAMQYEVTPKGSVLIYSVGKDLIANGAGLNYPSVSDDWGCQLQAPASATQD